MSSLTDKYHIVTTWGNYRGTREEGFAHAGFNAEHKPHFNLICMILTSWIVGGVSFILRTFHF